MPLRRQLAVVLGLVVLLAIVAAPAEAAKRRVPFGFFGAVLDPWTQDPGVLSDAAADGQMALMARSGVESVRVSMAWAATETSPGNYDWTNIDRTVAAAARHGIAVLGNVLLTPQWASERPNDPKFYLWAPTDPATFANFMVALIHRYGPNGTFWAANPSLPRVPVREWQIWNEQMANWFWADTPWAPSYTRMLKAAYPAIHAADHGAKVVAGSFVGVGPYSQWDGVRDLYRAGAKKYFDIIALHPFTNVPNSVKRSVSNVLRIISNVRARMRPYGDARKPIIITELSWPAAVGQVPSSRLLGLETTGPGMTQRLNTAYATLARGWRRLHVTQVDWYTWSSAYDPNSPQSDVSYRYAGLTRYTNFDGLTALPGGSFLPMPALATYAGVAKRWEGCRKGTDARRCG